jgi:hypothetical protein
MLAALNTFCCPNSIANAYSSLLSIFNGLQGNDEPLMAFHSQFDGLILEMARCKVVIPPLLLVMLFLRTLHGRYSDIMEQFRTQHKSLETSTIDLIVDDVNHHDTFILKEPRCGDKSSEPLSRVPAAASGHTNNADTVWNSPFDWLCKSYGDKGIKTWWK